MAPQGQEKINQVVQKNKDEKTKGEKAKKIKREHPEL